MLNDKNFQYGRSNELPNYVSNNLNQEEIFWIRQRFPWMGAFSGYDQLFQIIESKKPHRFSSIWQEHTEPSGIEKRFLRKFMRGAPVSPHYNIRSAAAEVRAILASWLNRPDLIHVTYVENNFGILAKHKKVCRMIGTCHQPSSWWRLMHPCPESIAALDGVIVLSTKEIPYFQKYLGEKVYFIPHGIDTDFFKPAVSSLINRENPRCVFSGNWLRDLNTLSNVIDLVLRKNSKVKFDLIFPRRKRQNEILHCIARHPQVSWHADLSDEDLLKIYQKASLLLLPLLDCTANNALLESMACGVPIISNQVGGISDYTTPDFATLLEVGDVSKMASAVLDLIDNPEKQKSQSKKARQHAVENFNWERVASQTLDVYSKILMK